MTKVLTKYKFNPHCVVAYPSFELFNTVRGYDSESQKNLQCKGTVKGTLSYASAKRMHNLVTNWFFCVKAIKKKNESWSKYLTFVTLTLSAKQFHSDREIKRKMLNRFIIESGRKWGVKTYIWKAEKQKNGNIHFHLLYDRYIDWQDIRNVWNKIQEDNGYIDKFYEEHGHRNPNSSDIHGLYKDKNNQLIGNLGSYIAKYFSKKEDQKHLLVDGKVWGRSKNLTKLGFFSEYEDSQLHEIWEYFQTLNVKKVKEEYFQLVFVNSWHHLEKNFPNFYREMINFYSKMAENIYFFTE